MTGELAQVVGVLVLLTLLIVTAAPILRAYRARHEQPRTDARDVIQATIVLEQRWRDEQARREQAEWERDELRQDVTQLEKERERWSDWQRKAEEYDALEILYDELLKQYDIDMGILSDQAQAAILRLAAVERYVPGVRSFLIALTTQSPRTAAQAQDQGASAQSLDTEGRSAGDTDNATAD